MKFRHASFAILIAVTLSACASESSIQKRCKANSGETPLHCAAMRGDVADIRRLIARGANVNEALSDEGEADDGATPLYVAMKYAGLKRGRAIDALLSAGADPNQPIKLADFIPLHMAASLGDAQAIAVLISYGANIHAGRDGYTPLHVAALRGEVNAIKALVQSGASVNRVIGDGRITPLHLAAHGGHANAITALVQSGARVNRADEDKATPLHYAAVQGKYDAVVALINNGANPRLREAGGRTALDVAINERGEDDDIAVLLCKKMK